MPVTLPANGPRPGASDADDALAGLDSYTAFRPNDRAFEVLAKNKGLIKGKYGGAKVNEQKIFDAAVPRGAESDAEVHLALLPHG